MRKKEFISKAVMAVAPTRNSGVLSHADMKRALDAFCEVAADILSGGGDVLLPGLGKLIVQGTYGYKKYNPDTGATIEIPPEVHVVLKPSKPFERKLNEKYKHK